MEFALHISNGIGGSVFFLFLVVPSAISYACFIIRFLQLCALLAVLPEMYEPSCTIIKKNAAFKFVFELLLAVAAVYESNVDIRFHSVDRIS